MLFWKYLFIEVFKELIVNWKLQDSGKNISSNKTLVHKPGLTINQFK